MTSAPMELSMDRKEMRRRNVRTGLILASIALAFFVGFIFKMRWLAG